ncbi:MAG: ABC transporter ATP-binding protein [Candidatus Hadarchaeota archaeon]
MISVNGLKKHFAGTKAVDIEHLKIEENQRVGLIGPNGAGKTTFINLVSGFLKPTDGKVFFRGNDVTDKDFFERSRMGIVKSFQIQKNFPSLTVLDHLLLAAEKDVSESFFDPVRAGSVESEKVGQKEKAEELLIELGLEEKKDKHPKSLSSGEIKLMDLGRALMMDFQILLLDECTAGLSDTETREIIDFLKDVGGQGGKSLLVVEHNLEVVWELSEKVFCLANGEIIAEGTPDHIKQDEQVIEKYLGWEK